MSFYKRIASRLNRFGSVRGFVQIVFLLTVIFIGIRFHLFTGQLEAGLVPTVERPPGVEGFLPISALIGLKYFFLTGIVNDVHPSGLLIFTFVSLISLWAKKSFCSWVCPVGFLSEILGRFHLRLFKNGFKPYRFIDLPLRGIKYLLLGFFIWTVFIKMNLFVLKQFLYSSYHVIADIKMLKFFVDMSATTLATLTLLLILTLLIRNFWCRYLCPYGAFLGIISLFSPFKIRRDEKKCIACGKCDRACPSNISISSTRRVLSDECFACGNCIDACPEKETLRLALPGRHASLKPVALLILIFLVFGGGSLAARLSGKWQNRVSGRAYLGHMLKNGLIDPDRLENPGDFIKALDYRGNKFHKSEERQP